MLLANSIATGAVLYVLILVFIAVSEAHFNSIVTLVARYMNRSAAMRRWRMTDAAKIVEQGVGLWLCVSPWVFGYADALQAQGSIAIIVGLGVLLFSFFDLSLPQEMKEWFVFALGVGLALSPWTQGYSDNALTSGNAVVSGLLIAGSAWCSQMYSSRGRQDKDQSNIS